MKIIKLKPFDCMVSALAYAATYIGIKAKWNKAVTYGCLLHDKLLVKYGCYPLNGYCAESRLTEIRLHSN